MQTESQAFNLAIEEVETTISMMNRKIDELINLDERLRAKETVDPKDAADIDRVFTNTFALEALYAGISAKDQYNKAMEEITDGIVVAIVAIVAALIAGLYKLLSYFFGVGSSSRSSSPAGYTINHATANDLFKVRDTIRSASSSNNVRNFEKAEATEAITNQIKKLSMPARRLLSIGLYMPNRLHDSKASAIGNFKEALKNNIPHKLADYWDIYTKYTQDVKNVLLENAPLTERKKKIESLSAELTETNEKYQDVFRFTLVEGQMSGGLLDGEEDPEQLVNKLANPHTAAALAALPDVLRRFCDDTTIDLLVKWSDSSKKSLEEIVSGLEKQEAFIGNLSNTNENAVLLKTFNLNYVKQLIVVYKNFLKIIQKSWEESLSCVEISIFYLELGATGIKAEQKRTGDYSSKETELKEIENAIKEVRETYKKLKNKSS